MRGRERGNERERGKSRRERRDGKGRAREEIGGEKRRGGKAASEMEGERLGERRVFLSIIWACVCVSVGVCARVCDYGNLTSTALTSPPLAYSITKHSRSCV